MKPVILLATFLLLATPLVTAAAIPSLYTNDNFFTSEQDAPAQLFRQLNGDFYGFTSTGKYFTQVSVVNDAGVPLQKFSIDRAYFYISDRGVIKAENDLAALSIYLAT